MKLKFNHNKIISLLLVFTMMISFVLGGCDNDSKPAKKPSKDNSSQSEAVDNKPADEVKEPDSEDCNNVVTGDPFDSADDGLDNLITSDATSYAELLVLNSTPVQDNMLGMGGIYHGFSFIPSANESWVYTDEMLEIELSRVIESGAKIVRTYYSPSYGFDYTTNTWDWDSLAMKQFYKYCQTMKDNGIKILINVGWSMENITEEICYSGYYTSDGKTPKNPFWVLAGGSNDQCYDYFYQWIIDTYKALAAAKLDNAMYFTFFTETGKGYNTYDTDQEYIDAAIPELEQNVKINEALKNAGIRDKITVIGPNTVDHNGLIQFRYVCETEKYLECFDILSHHRYLRGEYTRDSYTEWYYGVYSEIMSIAKPTGKEVWIDEWGYAPASADWAEEREKPVSMKGTQYALGMVAGMNSGVQTMLLWALSDQYWHGNSTTGGNSNEWENGVQITGIVPIVQNSTVPLPEWYAYSMISRYLYGDNIKVYKGYDDSGVYVTACQLADGNWTVIVVNMNPESKLFKIDFDEAINTKLYRHLYDPNTIKPTVAAQPIGADKTFNTVSTAFADELPAYGVAVYTSVKK